VINRIKEIIQITDSHSSYRNIQNLLCEMCGDRFDVELATKCYITLVSGNRLVGV